ncbi:MAG: hypothetical protein HQL69_07090 [Magnetococcales bacterium]|nr:hypothetical protein [Magnetococcales bacterium]
MTDAFMADESTATKKDEQSKKAESSGDGCKEGDNSLQSERKLSLEQKDDDHSSSNNQDKSYVDAVKPQESPKTELSPRAIPVEITDPWNVSDREDRSPIQRLKKLAIEISQAEDGSPKGGSPLEKFIQAKVSAKSSTTKKVDLPFAKVDTTNDDDKLQSSDKKTYVKRQKQGLDSVGRDGTSKNVVVAQETNPTVKSASQKQKSYNKNIGLPFTSIVESKKQPKVSKTEQTKSISTMTKVAIRDKDLLAKRPLPSKKDRTTIKRKQTMHEPSMLQGIFTDPATDLKKYSTPTPFTPAKSGKRLGSGNKISVAPTDKKFGILVEVTKLKNSSKNVDTTLKNKDVTAKADPVAIKNEENVVATKDNEKVVVAVAQEKAVVEEPTKAEKIVSLAKEVIDEQEIELSSSSFQPVISGSADTPLDSSKTLFSISKSEPQKESSQDNNLSLSGEKSSKISQKSVDISEESSDLAALLANPDGGRDFDSPTITLPDFAGYSGGISNGEQQDVTYEDIAFNSKQVETMKNTEEQYWAVPVESLGSGVANALGNAVGGVVYIGKVISGNSGKRAKKSAPKKTQTLTAIKKPLKRGQQVKEIMADKVGGGVGGIITGVGQMAKGGANVVVGTLGCIGGALVCLSGAKLHEEPKLVKKRK